MTTNENTSTVFVYREGARFLVRPATVVVRAGQILRWTNYTKETIEVLIPQTHRLGLRGGEIGPGERLDQEVPAVAAGAYPFAVYLSEARTFGEGNSGPIIIIEV